MFCTPNETVGVSIVTTKRTHREYRHHGEHDDPDEAEGKAEECLTEEVHDMLSIAILPLISRQKSPLKKGGGVNTTCRE